MNKKLGIALAGAAASVLVLSGCGSDDSDKEVQSWAGEVCEKVQPQLKNIQDANAEISKAASEKDPGKVKEADAQAFDKISKAYAAMATAVQGAGVPPVDDGKNTQSNAVRELKDTSRAYAELKSTVDELDTKDQGKFADGLKQVAGDLEELSKSGDEALNKLQAGELGQAMSEQRGCQKPAADSSKEA